MIRFLDLTLLLLMAFLLQADLAIERAVGLPRGDSSATGRNAGFMLHNTGRMFCGWKILKLFHAQLSYLQNY